MAPSFHLIAEDGKPEGMQEGDRKCRLAARLRTSRPESRRQYRFFCFAIETATVDRQSRLEPARGLRSLGVLPTVWRSSGWRQWREHELHYALRSIGPCLQYCNRRPISAFRRTLRSIRAVQDTRSTCPTILLAKPRRTEQSAPRVVLSELDLSFRHRRRMPERKISLL